MVAFSVLTLMIVKRYFTQLRAAVTLAKSAALKCNLSALNASGRIMYRSKCTNMYATLSISALILLTMFTIITIIF